MKIVFSACYMAENDARAFCRRILASYKSLKLKVNLNLMSFPFEKVVESITAEGNRHDIDALVKHELQHTSYMTIS